MLVLYAEDDWYFGVSGGRAGWFGRSKVALRELAAARAAAQRNAVAFGMWSGVGCDLPAVTYRL